MDAACTCGHLVQEVLATGKCLAASCDIHGYDITNQVVNLLVQDAQVTELQTVFREISEHLDVILKENMKLRTFAQGCAGMLRSPLSLSNEAVNLLDTLT